MKLTLTYILLLGSITLLNSQTKVFIDPIQKDDGKTYSRYFTISKSKRSYIFSAYAEMCIKCKNEKKIEVDFLEILKSKEEDTFYVYDAEFAIWYREKLKKGQELYKPCLDKLVQEKIQANDAYSKYYLYIFNIVLNYPTEFEKKLKLKDSSLHDLLQREKKLLDNLMNIKLGSLKKPNSRSNLSKRDKKKIRKGKLEQVRIRDHGESRIISTIYRGFEGKRQ